MIRWSEEQEELRSGFARWHASLSEGHLELDKKGAFSRALWEKVCESGILRLPFAEEHGGLGQDILTTMYVLESLGHGCRNAGLNFSISTHMVSAGVPLMRFASDAQKARYLPRLCDGSMIAAHAITEPGSGSDAMAMRTSARPSGEDYVLNGSKTFCTNGPVADLFVVYAKTNEKLGSWGVSAFFVERGTPGFSIGKPIEKMGLKTSPLCELFFEDCVVPADRLIGKPGLGFSILDHVMKWEILLCFIIQTGEMEARLERTIAYAKERQQFGKTIGSFQAVAGKIVEMKIGLENARRWLYDTAERFKAGQNITTDLAIAKLIASEANLQSALNAVQVHGGNGYMCEFGLEAELRNAVAGTIYSGTSEVQRDRIAKMLGL